MFSGERCRSYALRQGKEGGVRKEMPIGKVAENGKQQQPPVQQPPKTRAAKPTIPLKPATAENDENATSRHTLKTSAAGTKENHQPQQNHKCTEGEASAERQPVNSTAWRERTRQSESKPYTMNT
ncbi:hypothetical protein AVEN_197475-1 [Araneus ventricosus]|uniref:Uncharacterized protein n=1 Tax=Araneus ventricosus TaxID=182803 RepID=A0A4Y2NII7_ARAVE|nr:hypothetical protein AVEN_197475-1 [Araneus ventricosus]